MGFAFAQPILRGHPHARHRRVDNRSFRCKIAVLTVSDTRSLAEDKSGATLAERIAKAGHAVAARAIVTDDVEKIRAQVKAWIADPAIDVVITTGGTGFTGRDVTPEAIEPLFEKRMDGFATLFLMRQLRQDRHLGDPDAGDRRRRRRDLHLLPAGLARRLPRRLGRDPGAPARLSLSALQLRRDHAAARRAPAPRQGQRARRRDRVGWAKAAETPAAWHGVRSAVPTRIAASDAWARRIESIASKNDRGRLWLPYDAASSRAERSNLAAVAHEFGGLMQG